MCPAAVLLPRGSSTRLAQSLLDACKLRLLLASTTTWHGSLSSIYCPVFAVSLAVGDSGASQICCRCAAQLHSIGIDSHATFSMLMLERATGFMVWTVTTAWRE